VDYAAQIEGKRALLAETMRRAGIGVETQSIAAVPSPAREYRSRLTFHALRANRGPRTAFKSRGGKALIPVDDCPVADPALRKVLRDGAIIPPPGKDRFTLYGKDGLVIGEAEVDGRSRRRGEFIFLGKKLTVDAGCFFQSNAALLEKLLLQVRRGVEAYAPHSPASGMGDLYAGVGTFSVFLAEAAGASAERKADSGAADRDLPLIDLVEANSAALDAARINLGRHYPQGRFRFFAQSAEKWKPRGKWAFAIADPPRQGLAPILRGWLCAAGPSVLYYVSCEPSSLARDCRSLLKSYILKELTFYDFYPQTEHIESLAVLERRGCAE
jgi:23S rRNA (uracil1939-C5)-methyltransferase